MKTIFETCTPRPEVLKGELKDEVFRASLIDVHLQRAEAVYQDPSVFFENTYRTDGLRTLLRETFGRLTSANPGNSPVIRLETSFGGGSGVPLHGLLRGRPNPS
jgi:predicted AAA+ superfamily ATPase